MYHSIWLRKDLSNSWSLVEWLQVPRVWILAQSNRWVPFDESYIMLWRGWVARWDGTRRISIVDCTWRRLSTSSGIFQCHLPFLMSLRRPTNRTLTGFSEYIFSGHIRMCNWLWIPLKNSEFTMARWILPIKDGPLDVLDRKCLPLAYSFYCQWHRLVSNEYIINACRLIICLYYYFKKELAFCHHVLNRFKVTRLGESRPVGPIPSTSRGLPHLR